MSAAVILKIEVDDKGQPKLVELGRTMDKTKKQADSFTASVTGMFKSMMMYGAFQQLLGLIREAGDEILKFNKAFIEVQAISGRTNPEGAKAVKIMVGELKEMTIAMSNASEISAAKYAEVALTLTKLGIPVNEIKVIEQAMADLATTTGTDLIEATTGAIQISRSFGRELKGVADAANIMATTVLSTEDTFVNYMEAMKMVAPVANALGVSLEETSLYIGALGNLGIRGSMGGVALKNMLLDLLRPSKDLQEHMQGVSLQGMKFYQVLKLLKEKGANTQDLLSTFNLRAIPGALGLINTLSSKIEYLFNLINSKSIDVTAVAKDIREAWINQMLMLKNNFLNIFMEISMVFEETNTDGGFKGLVFWLQSIQNYFRDNRREIRETVQTWITNIVKFVTVVGKNLDNLIFAMKMFIAYKVIMFAGSSVIGIIGAIQAITTATTAAGVAAEGAAIKGAAAWTSMLGPIALVTTAIIGVSEIYRSHIQDYNKSLRVAADFETKSLVEKKRRLEELQKFQMDGDKAILAQSMRIKQAASSLGNYRILHPLSNVEDSDQFKKLQKEISAYNEILRLQQESSRVNTAIGAPSGLQSKQIRDITIELEKAKKVKEEYLSTAFPTSDEELNKYESKINSLTKSLEALKVKKEDQSLADLKFQEITGVTAKNYEKMIPSLKGVNEASYELHYLQNKIKEGGFELWAENYVDANLTQAESIKNVNEELERLNKILSDRTQEEKDLAEAQEAKIGVETALQNLNEEYQKSLMMEGKKEKEPYSEYYTRLGLMITNQKVFNMTMLDTKETLESLYDKESYQPYFMGLTKSFVDFQDKVKQFKIDITTNTKSLFDYLGKEIEVKNAQGIPIKIVPRMDFFNKEFDRLLTLSTFIAKTPIENPYMRKPILPYRSNDINKPIDYTVHDNKAKLENLRNERNADYIQNLEKTKNDWKTFQDAYKVLWNENFTPGKGLGERIKTEFQLIGEYATTALPILSDKINLAIQSPLAQGILSFTNTLGESMNGLLSAVDSLYSTKLSNLQLEHETELQNLSDLYEKKKKYAEGDTDYLNYLAKKQAKAEKILKDKQKAEEDEIKKKQQKFAIAQAFINGALAITNILANGHPLLWPIQIPFAIAMTAFQIAAISQQKFADGGLVRGKGTGRSDSIPIMVSNGEYIIPEQQVKNHGGAQGIERMIYGTTNKNNNINIRIDTMVGDKRFVNDLITQIRKELPRRI